MATTSAWNERDFRLFYDKLFGPNMKSPPKERCHAVQERMEWPLKKVVDPTNTRNMPKKRRLGDRFSLFGAELSFHYRGDQLELSHRTVAEDPAQEGLGLELVIVPKWRRVYEHGEPLDKKSLPEPSYADITDQQAIRVRLAPRSASQVHICGMLSNNGFDYMNRVDLTISVWVVDIFKIVDFTVLPVFSAPGDTVTLRSKGHAAHVSRQLLAVQSPVLADVFNKNPEKRTFGFPNDLHSSAFYQLVGLFIDDQEPISLDLMDEVSSLCVQLGFSNGLRACARRLKRAVNDAQGRAHHIIAVPSVPSLADWSRKHGVEATFVQVVSSAKKMSDVTDLYTDVDQWSDQMMGLLLERAMQCTDANDSDRKLCAFAPHVHGYASEGEDEDEDDSPRTVTLTDEEDSVDYGGGLYDDYDDEDEEGYGW